MTLIHTTIRPDQQIDVDAAELESLTRQGLVVGTPAPTHSSSPDTVVAYVSTTLNPNAVLGVGAAEWESLTRQHLIAHNFGSTSPARPASGAATGAAAARTPTVTTSSAIPAGLATGSGTALTPGSGYGLGGYGTTPYGL